MAISNPFAPRPRLALCGLAAVLHFGCTLITDVDRSKIPQPASTFIDAGGSGEPAPEPKPTVDAGSTVGASDAGSDAATGDAAAADAAPDAAAPVDADVSDAG
jgi:hypothetical protein